MVINKILIILGFSNAMILYWFYILVGLGTLLLIYLIAKQEFDENTAFYSALIYSLSFAQFIAYWFMLWKNAIGVFLVLLIIYLSR